jgi:hypothetical protein
MTEITLADYTGFLLQEIVKARQMADEYSRQVALSYAQDPMLQHFPTPRFKLPKVELTIPVLVSGTRFSNLARFQMKEEAFAAHLQERVEDILRVVGAPGGDKPPPRAPSTARRGTRAVRPSAAIDALAREFHARLMDNPDPTRPQSIVTNYWSRIFEQTLRETGLTEVHRRTDPANELLARSTNELLGTVQANTSISRSRIDSLLVDPETHSVKSGSTDMTVFTIKAELLEEGVQIRSARDESTGEARPVVEFE